MSATATAFTLVVTEDPQDGGSARDFVVTDNGALWRCPGMVDTAAFLFDIGFSEASEELLEAPRTGWTRRPPRLTA